MWVSLTVFDPYILASERSRDSTCESEQSMYARYKWSELDHSGHSCLGLDPERYQVK